MNDWMIRTALGAALLAGTSAMAAAQDEAQSPIDRLDAIEQEYDNAEQAFRSAYRGAETDEERQEAFKLRPDGNEFFGRFKELATEVRGTEAAAKSWIWVMRLGRNQTEDMEQALRTLVDEHLESAAIKDLPGMLRYSRLDAELCTSALQTMIDDSPHDSVKASALFSLGARTIKEDPAAAKALFERVVADFPDEKDHVTRAESSLFELNNLQIGMVAPDIEGNDLNGVAFRLSDYRGKVVVLDFWGNW